MNYDSDSFRKNYEYLKHLPIKMKTTQMSGLLPEVIELLNAGNYSCVIKTGSGEILTFTQRGVKDLFQLVQNKKKTLKNAVVADKIIGKAAAALLVLGEVKSVYANIISLPALDLLTKNGIHIEYNKTTDVIMNRDNTDICPLEKLCGSETSVTLIFNLINGFFNPDQIQ